MRFSKKSMDVTVMICEDMGSAINDVHALFFVISCGSTHQVSKYK
jgi:hypothetical protein